MEIVALVGINGFLTSPIPHTKETICERPTLRYVSRVGRSDSHNMKKTLVVFSPVPNSDDVSIIFFDASFSGLLKATQCALSKLESLASKVDVTDMPKVGGLDQFLMVSKALIHPDGMVITQESPDFIDFDIV